MAYPDLRIESSKIYGGENDADYGRLLENAIGNRQVERWFAPGRN